MHPKTPINVPFFLFVALNSVKRFLMVSSAFSLIEQVLINIKSASSKFLVAPKPSVCNIDATISLSLKFIAQP